jgi:hypothetical protein
VVWDREGEEGTELRGLYRGKEERDGKGGSEDVKGGRGDLAPKIFLDPPLL